MTRETIQGHLKTSFTLHLQDNIVNVVRLRVIRVHINYIPGDHLFGGLYRRMKDDLSSWSLRFLRALLKEGCILLVNVIQPRDKTDVWLQSPFGLCIQRGTHHKILGGVVDHYH